MNKMKKQYKKSLKCKKNGTEKGDTIDSFRDLKTNHINDIDEKIKYFKSRLASLWEGTSDTVSEDKKESGDCGSLETKRSNFDVDSRSPSERTLNEDISNCSTTTEPSPSATVSSKFSKWLNSTIDLIDEEIKEENVCSKTSLYNSKFNSGKNSRYSSTKSLSTSNFPQYNVERLLYKSFLLKNLGRYSSDESDAEVVEIIPKKSKIQKKSTSRVLFQKRKKSGRKRDRKRRRVVMYDTSYSDLEIINSDECNNAGESFRTNAEELNLDGINWEEPFSSEENSIFETSILEVSPNRRNEGYANNNHLTPKFAQPSNTHPKENSNQKAACSDIGGRLEKTKATWECPICFEPSTGQEIVTTLCGHIFCRECVEQYHSIQGKICPVCRSDLSDTALITLFNV